MKGLLKMVLEDKNLKRNNLFKVIPHLIVMKDPLLILKVSQGKRYLLKLYPVNFKKILMILLMLIGKRESKYHLNSKLSMISWKSVKSLILKISAF